MQIILEALGFKDSINLKIVLTLIASVVTYLIGDPAKNELIFGLAALVSIDVFCGIWIAYLNKNIKDSYKSAKKYILYFIILILCNLSTTLTDSTIIPNHGFVILAIVAQWWMILNELISIIKHCITIFYDRDKVLNDSEVKGIKRILAAYEVYQEMLVDKICKEAEKSMKEKDNNNGFESVLSSSVKTESK
jgi:phage-related holin